MRVNPNCDGQESRPTCSDNNEVRVLPWGTEPGHGNSILCHNHFDKEIAWRKERNRELGVEAQYDLPKWDSLRVYGE